MNCGTLKFGKYYRNSSQTLYLKYNQKYDITKKNDVGCVIAKSFIFHDILVYVMNFTSRSLYCNSP